MLQILISLFNGKIAISKAVITIMIIIKKQQQPQNNELDTAFAYEQIECKFITCKKINLNIKKLQSLIFYFYDLIKRMSFGVFVTNILRSLFI